MGSYKAIQGQSIYDVCLQTYGTLKYLFKLIIDNDIDNLNAFDFREKVFIFDQTLINDNSIFQRNTNDKIFYTTKQAQIQAGGLQTDDGIDLQTDDGIQIIVD